MKTTLKQPHQHPQPSSPQSPKTHSLKPRKRQDSQTKSMSHNDKSALSTNQLLSSISTKLNPNSISISNSNYNHNHNHNDSQQRWSGITTEKVEIRVSCLDGLRVPRFNLTDCQATLDFQELRRRFARRKGKGLCTGVTCVQKNKRLCGDANCPIKLRWKSKLVLEIKDTKQAENLKNYILSSKQQFPYDRQIDKDVLRSFPDKALPKARLTLYHTSTEKNNLIQALRTVLKMLSVCDHDVGYVQGMNLFTAVIVSHIKEVQLSFTFVREVMKYGNMRKMYTNNFKNMKQLCHNLLHRHIKILIPDLYETFTRQGILLEMFMPFYLSMFACVVDYNVMHCVIDEFMAKGFLFLDKLMLSMLSYLRLELMEAEAGEIAYKIGASYLRGREIPWDEVINLTQTFQLN